MELGEVQCQPKRVNSNSTDPIRQPIGPGRTIEQESKERPPWQHQR